jgi:D-hexose-6-phosphate mutarotase
MADEGLVIIRKDSVNYATVNLHGATLQSWIHEGNEVIFVSRVESISQ